MSCVGKSFVFDLVKGSNVQFFFSLKSVSSILLIGELPGLGIYLFNTFETYFAVCRAISVIFLVVLVLFFVFFIAFPKDKIE